MPRTTRARSVLVTRVLAVLTTAWLCGAPFAAAAPFAPADNCAYASIDGRTGGGGAVAVSGDGVICSAGPRTPPPKKPAPKPPPP
ncbi:hypothetical protein G3I40_01600, partial [Streptomyces sp. SID14478]|nr:hypothetical protein [Streptomyces sp. SID14478]